MNKYYTMYKLAMGPRYWGLLYNELSCTCIYMCIHVATKYW